MSKRFGARRPRRSFFADRGVVELAFENDRNRKRRSGLPLPPKPLSAPRTGKKPSSRGVGDALQKAYQDALKEDIPPEMLDLLGKLG